MSKGSLFSALEVRHVLVCEVLPLLCDESSCVAVKVRREHAVACGTMKLCTPPENVDRAANHRLMCSCLTPMLSQGSFGFRNEPLEVVVEGISSVVRRGIC